MKSQNLVIVTIGVVFVFVIAGVVAIAVAVPEGANPGSLIALLIATVAPTIATLVTLARVDTIRDAQRQIQLGVHELGNGVGDAKIQRNVHAALDERQRNTTTAEEQQ